MTTTTIPAYVAIASGANIVAPALVIVGASLVGLVIVLIVVRFTFGFLSSR